MDTEENVNPCTVSTQTDLTGFRPYYVRINNRHIFIDAAAPPRRRRLRTRFERRRSVFYEPPPSTDDDGDAIDYPVWRPKRQRRLLPSHLETRHAQRSPASSTSSMMSEGMTADFEVITATKTEAENESLLGIEWSEANPPSATSVNSLSSSPSAQVSAFSNMTASSLSDESIVLNPTAEKSPTSAVVSHLQSPIFLATTQSSTRRETVIVSPPQTLSQREDYSQRSSTHDSTIDARQSPSDYGIVESSTPAAVWELFSSGASIHDRLSTEPIADARISLSDEIIEPSIPAASMELFSSCSSTDTRFTTELTADERQRPSDEILASWIPAELLEQFPTHPHLPIDPIVDARQDPTDDGVLQRVMSIVSTRSLCHLIYSPEVYENNVEEQFLARDDVVFAVRELRVDGRICKLNVVYSGRASSVRTFFRRIFPSRNPSCNPSSPKFSVFAVADFAKVINDLTEAARSITIRSSLTVEEINALKRAAGTPTTVVRLRSFRDSDLSDFFIFVKWYVLERGGCIVPGEGPPLTWDDLEGPNRSRAWDRCIQQYMKRSGILIAGRWCHAISYAGASLLGHLLASEPR